MIEDEQGREWRSVRDAYWQGRLGFPPVHFAEEQQELLLRVLASIDRGWSGAEESKNDLFDGDMLFWRFYQCWLAAIGLLATGPRADPLSAPLSDEGRSVLAMLRATRDPAWIPLPFADVLATARSVDPTAADEEREQALRVFERDAARLPHLFAREGVHGHHLVALTGFDTVARMPMRKVVWSQAFPDARTRDDFFAWLAERVDRWEDWGKLAYSKGANALTQHLLGLLAARLREVR